MSGSKKPPFIAEWIINRLSLYKSKYQMNDDLLEEYNSIRSHKGRIRADFWYRRQCLHAIKFYIGLIIPRSCMMLKNYLKIALRNISRQKGYSFINIAGLAVGIACCILISLWCIDELSFDKFHNDIERLYRVGTVSQEASVFTTTSARLAPALKETFPQVEAAARIRRMSSKVIRKGEKIFTENRFMYANADFLEVFKFPFIYGNEDAALDRPYTVLLSRQMAEKYFGNNDPVGDTIIIENEDFEVTGVISDLRENTHLKYGFIASFKTVEDTDWFSNWQSNVFYTYIKLAP
ncbi:MAG: ABC transporter permease, partial [bacterium]|nr:ABC transporter permease [bacterium]